MLRKRTFGVAVLLVVAGVACHDAVPTAAPGTSPGDAPPGPAFSTLPAPVEYPLHIYGDETDDWPYMTPEAGTYVEILADVQTPQPLDNDLTVRVCPNDQYVGRNAHLRMHYRLETLDFDFRGPFTFVRHVSTTSPYPTALYIFNRNAYTRDNKYYAPAGNNVLLACNGRYVIRNNVIRLWAGHLYGKLYNGPIVLNPDYDECEDGGGGGAGGGGTELTTVADPGYDPYNPSYQPASGGGGSGCAPGGDDGNPSGGSGTQFEPGDYTGGETVDWGTGVGNGGSSACGASAVVEYVCIDVWDDAEGDWVEWGCGYVTSC